MTEAARRQLAKPPRRLPVGAPVLWGGIALGTFLAVEALRHGVMLSLFGGFADAILTFVLLVAAGVGLAELTRRHHRTVARHAVRHGKRGASAAYRGTRRHGGRGAAFVAGKARAAVGRLASPAGSAGRGGRSAAALRGMGHARCPRTPFTGSSITQLNRR